MGAVRLYSRAAKYILLDLKVLVVKLFDHLQSMIVTFHEFYPPSRVYVVEIEVNRSVNHPVPFLCADETFLVKSF